MKTFAQYLTESEKTFDYRIKIVGDLPAGFFKEFKTALKKFDPSKITDVKTTPVLSKPTDFPTETNQVVNIIDATFRYPATFQQVQQMARLAGIPENRICMNDLKWSEGIDKELLGIEEQNKDLLANTEYPANSKEQDQLKKDYAAVAHEKQVVKNSAADAKFTVAGGKTPAAHTTDDLPQNNKSPMSAVKRPPLPDTGKNPQGK